MNRIKRLDKLKEFLLEDIGDYDVSTDLLFPADQQGVLRITAKEEGVFCGGWVITDVCHLLNERIKADVLIPDGADIRKGTCLAEVHGPMVDLLKGERVILNCIQRMSGIATLTKQAVQALENPKIRLCDTRKTTPGLRLFEKYAVQTGGGYNHRFGLYDAVMLKDNHIAFYGSLTNAVRHLKEKVGHMVKIEVETETDEQILEAVDAGVDCIMFDNRRPEDIARMLPSIPNTITTEASGGISLENLSDYRHLTVDYLSLGFLTHSVRSLDFSARAVLTKEEIH
ncbi:carboxylating nicotinate-nucleotide diphosphorylase [Halobacillus halophilus]|uniref:carboxylating nicotinate-nucleotide diphosphorylase n=1 Tax=Halobacillus halophilus TaxID=1570 RepID=UPI00137152F0|nr:carboxylating nicotinate-nucleotide diphosphorylase [Halobacillus halophilus]